MNKRVETDYPVHAMFLDRWSPRSFSERVPEREKLQALFEAARLAPSAHNTQPTRFLLIRKQQHDAYERLYRCLSPGNQEWVHSAQVLILTAGMRQRFSQKDGTLVPYPHFMHDVGLAVMSLILQARELGLHCHPMAGFDPEQASSDFQIPPLFEPVVLIAVGYLGDPCALPEALRHKELGPRLRRPLQEVVFEEAWGEASPLFTPAEPRE